MLLGISFLIGAAFFKLAQNRKLNGIIYGIFATVVCYFAFIGMFTLLPIISKNIENGAILLFSILASFFGLMIVFIILNSAAKEKAMNEHDKNNEE